jgi:hypothetical protein
MNSWAVNLGYLIMVVLLNKAKSKTEAEASSDRLASISVRVSALSALDWIIYSWMPTAPVTFTVVHYKLA